MDFRVHIEKDNQLSCITEEIEELKATQTALKINGKT